jgi:hypothetical protein
MCFAMYRLCSTSIRLSFVRWTISVGTWIADSVPRMSVFLTIRNRAWAAPGLAERRA